MTQDDIHKKVEATLDTIDTITRAEAPPFFYTRLLAKMDTRPSITWWQIWFATLTKPTFAVVTLSLFVVLNITVISVTIKDKKQSNTTSESTTIQGFAQDYNLSTTTVYTDK